MRRMRSITSNMFRRLQNSHESHIEALCAGHGNRQRRSRVEGNQAGDLANHRLADGRPVGELFGRHAGFEAEKD